MNEFVPSAKDISAEDISGVRDILDANVEEFTELVRKVSYVDHSLLVKVFFTPRTRLFVSAPKMFGKSSNMSMLRRFFEVQKDGTVPANLEDRHQYAVFKNLKIVTEGDARVQDHFCSHPVIYVNFKSPEIHNFEDALDCCYGEIWRAFREHKHYLKGNLEDDDKSICEMWWNAKRFQDVGKDNVRMGLAELCRYLYIAHEEKSVLILVDECDAIVTSALSNNCDQRVMRHIAGLTTAIFSAITKGNITDCLQGVLLTGISYISGVGYSDDIKLDSCRFLDDSSGGGFRRVEIVPFYGLYEEQVDELFGKLKERLSFTDEDIEGKQAEIAHYFNGYRTIINQKCVYPLYLVVDYLVHGIEPKYNRFLPPIVTTYCKVACHADVAPSMLTLLGNGNIDDVDDVDSTLSIDDLVYLRDNPSSESIDTFLMLLCEVGMLTNAGGNNLKIPNQVTGNYFLKELKKTGEADNFGKFNFKLMKDCAKDMNSLRKLLTKNDRNGFKERLKSFHQNLRSVFAGFEDNLEQCSENSLNGLILMTLSFIASRSSKFAAELPITDYQNNQGKIHFWMVDEKFNFALLVNFKIDLKAETNKNGDEGNKDRRKGEKEKTSIYALQELRGEGDEQVQYLDELKKRHIEFYILMGLSMNGSCEPSISIATSVQPDQTEDEETFICVSETETIDFPELYESDKCIDLLHGETRQASFSNTASFKTVLIYE